MRDIITVLGTPVPAMLVAGGIVFLLLAVAGEFAGKIKLSPEQRKWAGIIGVLLLLLGIALYVVPGAPPPGPTPTVVAVVTPDTPMPTPVAPTDTPTRKPIDTSTPKLPTDTPVHEPTDTPEPPTNTPIPPIAPTPTRPICYGNCWQYDENARTMTWTGPTDGAEDIWQPQGIALDRIRSGWTAIFGPLSVPGEIEACILTLNDQVVKNACDGVLYHVEAGGPYKATSAHPEAGGFRWKPADGYGYRATQP